jgi:DNA-binding NarL/FixJ family response regulator
VIRVLIADDEALVRGGLRMILEAQGDIEVTADVEDGRAALEFARRDSPDVVLMDIRMPGVDGLEATRRMLDLRASPLRVLILTTFDLDEYVYEALRAGASGFLLKSARPKELVAAVRAAVAGDTLLAPQITRRLVESFVRRPPPGTDTAPELEQLTQREVDVLHEIARGRSNAEIARELFVSDETVKTHVSRIFTKLGVRDRTQAVISAYDCGLVDPRARNQLPPPAARPTPALRRTQHSPGGRSAATSQQLGRGRTSSSAPPICPSNASRPSWPTARATPSTASAAGSTPRAHSTASRTTSHGFATACCLATLTCAPSSAPASRPSRSSSPLRSPLSPDCRPTPSRHGRWRPRWSRASWRCRNASPTTTTPL